MGKIAKTVKSVLDSFGVDASFVDGGSNCRYEFANVIGDVALRFQFDINEAAEFLVVKAYPFTKTDSSVLLGALPKINQCNNLNMFVKVQVDGDGELRFSMPVLGAEGVISPKMVASAFITTANTAKDCIPKIIG